MTDETQRCGRGWHRVVDGMCCVIDLWDTGEVRYIPICERIETDERGPLEPPERADEGDH